MKLKLSTFTDAKPDDDAKFSTVFGSSGISSSSSSSNGFHVATTQLSVNGHCIATVTIVGNGIRKLIDFPCKGVPFPIINYDQTLVVGNEYYTENPGVLIHVGDICKVEYFKDAAGRPTDNVSTLSAEDCVKVKQRIVILQQHYERWAEYYKNKNKEVQQHLQALQSNLFSALGGLFGGLPFGK